MAFRGPWDDPSDRRVLSALGEATGEPSGFYDTSLLTVTWNDGTRTLTLTPVSDTFLVYVNGVKYLKRTETVTITDTEGLWYVYYDSDGVLTASQTFPTSLTNNALVWVCYWDATNNKAIIQTGSNELHGTTMTGSTHQYLHDTFGAQFESGMALGNLTTDGDGSSQDHITFSVAPGEMHDEDVGISISDGSPQDLSPIVQIPVYYLEGATPVWRKQDASNFAIILDGASGRAAYNNNNAGTWEQVAVTSNQFVLVHIFCTNDKDTPIIAVQGQNDYTNKTAASAGAEVEIGTLYTVGLPVAEWIPIATLIVQTKNTYTNTQKSRYVTDVDGADYIDWRTQQLQAVGASVTNLISAGDSYVSVNDSGTGEVITNVDGTDIITATASDVSITKNIELTDDQYIQWDTGLRIIHSTGGLSQIYSYYHGGGIRIAVETSGGVTRNMLDVGVDDDQFNVRADKLRVYDIAGVISGYFTHEGTNNFNMINETDGGKIVLYGTSSGFKTMLELNPTGAANIYHAGVKTIYTGAGEIHLVDSTGALTGYFSHEGTNNFNMINETDGGKIVLYGTSSGFKTMLELNPTGAANIYYQGVKEAETVSGGLKATNGFQIGTSSLMTDIKDEDTMVSDSATALATQQSIKAYVDGVVGAARKNAIINGDFDIWQRGTSFATAGTIYTADRLKHTTNNDGAVTISQDTDVPTEAESGHTSKYSFKVDVTTADGTMASGQYALLSYAVEGYDFQHLKDQTATLSFWVKSNKTGTYCVSFQNSSPIRSYVVEYTISSASTWEKKEISITFDEPTGTWDLTDGMGMKMWWCLGAGTDFQGTPDQWNSANDVATSNQVNFMDDTANNFWLAQVQLEKGSIATPFEHRPIQEEIALCQRYYQKSYDIGQDPGSTATPKGLETTAYSTSDAGVAVRYATLMRSSPTVTLYSNVTGNSGNVRIQATDDPATVSSNYNDEGGFGLIKSTGSNFGSGDWVDFHYVADAEL